MTTNSTCENDRWAIPELARETDHGNALRLAKELNNKAFYDHRQNQWLIWTGSHWAYDVHKSIVPQAVKILIRTLGSEVGLAEWLTKSLAGSKISAALKLAQSEMPLINRLDAHPMKLNVLNGTIDLATGVLMPHRPEDFLTKIANVEFQAGATCPQWDAFLNWAFSENKEGTLYFQKLIGYALTGDTSEKKFFIFLGPSGNNGKTMMVNVIRAILGRQFCTQMAAESLTIDKPGRIRSDIARLAGYRFIAASETTRQFKFDEALIKTISGSDAVTARKLYQNEIEFTPEGKLFIVTNSQPVFNIADKAMMSRVDIIPFLNSVTADQIDRKLTSKLIDEEGAGILAWAVEGARLWALEGLGDNPFAQEALHIHRPTVTVDQFVATCCAADQGAVESSKNLHRAYLEFKAEAGDASPDPNLNQFGLKLTDAGFRVLRRRDGNYREGIGLQPKWQTRIVAS